MRTHNIETMTTTHRLNCLSMSSKKTETLSESSNDFFVRKNIKSLLLKSRSDLLLFLLFLRSCEIPFSFEYLFFLLPLMGYVPFGVEVFLNSISTIPITTLVYVTAIALSSRLKPFPSKKLIMRLR